MMLTTSIVVIMGAIVGVATYAYTTYKKKYQNKFRAIGKSEFNSVLRNANLKKDYEEGRILCSVSGEPITFDNLGYIDIRSDGEIIFISRNSLPSAAQIPRSELKQIVA